MKIYELQKKQYLYLAHKFQQEPDFFTTTGTVVNGSVGIPDPASNNHGAWNFNTGTKTLTVLVKGKDNSPPTQPIAVPIDLKVYRCHYNKCVVPTPPPAPKGRPEKAGYWSKSKDWIGTLPGYGGYNGILPKDGDNVMIDSDKWIVADIQTPKLKRLYIYGTLELENGRSHNLSAEIIFISGLYGNLIVGWPDKPMIDNVFIRLLGNKATKDLPLNNGPNVGAKALAVFARLQMIGRPRKVSWTRLAKTADVGSNEIALVKPVDWQVGEEIMISSTTYESRQVEKFKITAVKNNGTQLTLSGTFKYKHIGGNYMIGDRKLVMAAKVALLTRNIKIEGADDPVGARGESFGCRVLVGSYSEAGKMYTGKAVISNVEFSHCGQYGWNEGYDPRYALAFLDAGTINGNDSYVKDNAFHDGYNSGIGIFGTNNLLVKNNALHHVVGSGIRNEGSGNQLINNLVVLAIAPHTYKGLIPKFDIHWPGAIEVIKATNTSLRGNVIAGSEKIGFLVEGESCSDINQAKDWRDNEAHSCLHGIHLPYDGHLPVCSRISNFFSWKNYDYGIFAWPTSSIIVSLCTFADNTDNLFLNVAKPPSLSHRRIDKFIEVRDSLVIGVSPSYDCVSDNNQPYPATMLGSRGRKSPTGGMIGVLMASFTSNPSAGPLKPWDNPMSYPAIGGIVRFKRTTFANFVTACGGKETTIFVPNAAYGDIMHPTELESISLINVTEANKVGLLQPITKWINPSDCVDMDCDARRKLVIKDIDGSMFGAAGSSIISKSEYQWGGDRRFGLGNYRIPKTLIANSDGTMIDADTKFPKKGIVRGTNSKSLCTYSADFGAYKCNGLDYYFFVVESMDEDTETRRLSPVALAANGYVDLINGPMDHGCCHGYTCQERISTFYTVVASQLKYTLHFTSFNPHKTRLHFLNSKSTDAILISIYYAKPQRLDVYFRGVYILPTNAKLQGQDFELMQKDPAKPANQYLPTFSGNPGLNYFDNAEKLLHILVKGSEFFEIRTTPVIQLSMGVSTTSVSTSDFFKKNLVKNLAALLGIDPSKVRVMEVISASGTRRRRATSSLSYVNVQIGDPPQTTTNTSATNQTTNSTSFSELEDLTTKVVQTTQTGSLATATGLDLSLITVTEPEPDPVDPTGGVRATNETVQVVNATNSTQRYDEKISVTDATSGPTQYLIPKSLALIAQPSGSNETISFPFQPQMRMYDALNRWVSQLGRATDRWRVTASIVAGTGDPNAQLIGNTTVEFINGTANFSTLAITHSGNGYRLKFNVTYPLIVKFEATSAAFDIKERDLYFTLTNQPGEANETVPFVQQPSVEVRDRTDGELATNTGWRGRQWLFKTELISNGNSGANLNGSTTVQFANGYAQFTNLSIDTPGKGYQLRLSTMTLPSSRYSAQFISVSFEVKERLLYLRIVQQPGNCNDTVVCGNQPILEIRSRFPDALVGNLGWKGDEWFVNASVHSGGANSVLNGTSYLKIPRSGLIAFTDLRFYDVASGYKLRFDIVIKPANPRFANMSLVSVSFDVNQRVFYLAVKSPVSNANDSVVFGHQPEIEVRDAGTNRAAKPLKRSWYVTVTIANNPTGGTLNGTHSVLIHGEVARFIDLSITGYGVGYTLRFQSNYGHQAISQPFNVRFKNDYRPVFDVATASIINVYENETTPKALHTFLATDQDIGIAGNVKYTIETGALNWLFDLSQSTGVFRLISGLDRENVSSYSLNIRASDSAPSPFELTKDVALKVNVLDINDNQPKYDWPVLNITVPEIVLVGQNAFNVTTTDPDEGENGRITYELLNSNDTGKFSLITTTGIFKAASSLDLDGSNMPEPVYCFNMNVHDNGIRIQQSVNITVYIRITRVNEYTPAFNQSHLTVSLTENTAVNTTVLVVNANDLDSGPDGNVSYQIISGDASHHFSLSNAILTVAKALDYETQTSFSLVIQARDNPSSGAPRTSTLTVIVNVIDVNDNAPVFSLSSNVITIPDNAVVGSNAAAITATDADSGRNGQLEYYMTANSSSLFTLDKATGVLYPRRSLDLDILKMTSMEVTMTVFVTDKGAPAALNSPVNVTLRIVAVNEYSPVLKHAAQMTMLLAADKSVGEQILQINATDDDYDADGRLLFSFTGGNKAGVFSIDNSTGVVTLASVPTGQFYALGILVSDQAPIAERKSVTVQVVLLNLRSSNGTGSGSVYVGSVRGSVPLTISSSSSMSVPVHINVGTQDLAAFDVNITYDSSIIRYVSIATDYIAMPSLEHIRILGLVSHNKTMIGIPKIADITFTGILSIASTAGLKDAILMDKNAEQIPQQLVKPTACPQMTIGDANKDCFVDIRDAAFIQTYAREAMNGFTSAVGRRLQSEVNDVQRLSLDTDKNGMVDYEDAKMSRDVLLGYSAFISNVTLANPAAPDCKLAITASLRNMRGDAVSNAQAFVVFSYTSNALNAELSNSGLASVTSYSLAGNVHGTVIKLNSLGSGLYKIESTNPKLRKNGVGMTLVFSLTTSASQIKVTDTFKKPSNSMAGSKVTVDFGSGIKADVYQLYAPQSVVNFTEPNSICQNPTVTKHFKLKFDMSFNTIQGKEAAFIAAFKSFFLKKYSKPGREIILSNITATPGSIVVGFNVKVLESKKDSIVNDVVGDVKSGLTFSFESTTFTAAPTLVIDGKENIPPTHPVSKGENKTLIIIIVVVVVVLLLFIIVVVVVWLKKRKQRVKTISVDEIGNPRKNSNHSTPLHLKDIELKKRKNSPDSNDIIFTDFAAQS
eukprot:gene6712-7474_t